jgi:hypothetical protein
MRRWGRRLRLLLLLLLLLLRDSLLQVVLVQVSYCTFQPERDLPAQA